MADFFERLKKGAKEAGEKAVILGKIGGIKTQITNINLKKEGVFKELGKALFTHVKNGEIQIEFPQDVKEVIENITSLETEVAKLNEEIAKLNEELKKVGATEEEVKKANEEPPVSQGETKEEVKEDTASQEAEKKD